MHDPHHSHRGRSSYSDGSRHASSRLFLRGLGFVLVAIGGIFALVGFIDFFSSFGSFHPPTLFWCCFIGLPMVGLGIALLKMGFLGVVTRYVAGETVPVARDSAVEIAEGLRPTIRGIAADLHGAPATSAGAAVTPPADPAQRLARLDKLRADGLISEAEHTAQRARMLSEL